MRHLFAIVLVLSLACTAGAEVITLGFDQEVSDGVAPLGSIPWLTAIFDDGGTSGSVLLTLDAGNLIDLEFVGKWLFNLDPLLDPEELVFGAPTMIGDFVAPRIRTGEDRFRAPGGRRFDILLDFSQSLRKRFGAGESMTIEIMGIDSLTASSFDALSTARCENEPLLSIAHVQSINQCGRGSGWIAPTLDSESNQYAPEPSSLVMLALTALVALAGWRRR